MELKGDTCGEGDQAREKQQQQLTTKEPHRPDTTKEPHRPYISVFWTNESIASLPLGGDALGFFPRSVAMALCRSQRAAGSCAQQLPITYANAGGVSSGFFSRCASMTQALMSSA